MLYVGLAGLLPLVLRALCSCAGLFYAQVVEEQGDAFVVEVAALPRYFDADRVTQERHVCEITLTYAQLDQLTEYDRSLAAKATCDIREHVAEQALLSRRQIARYVLAQSAKTMVTSFEDAPVSVALPAACEVSAPLPLARAQIVSHQIHSSRQEAQPSVDIDDVRFEMTTIEVPVEDLQEIFREQKRLTVGDHHYRPSQRGWNLSLLVAGMQYLKQERLQTDSWERKRELKAKERDLRQALSLRDRVPLQMEITPIYARGKNGSMTGCQMTIDVPVLAA